MMSETQTIKSSPKKRPVFLIVLLVLTSLSLLTTLFTGVFPLATGPMNDEQLQKEELNMAKSKSEMNKLFDDEEMKQALSDGLDLGFTKITFIHKKAFWIYHFLQFIAFGLGAAAVYFMFRLKKIGFHLYIIYCLISAAQVYLVFPKELIVTSEFVTGFLVSGVFVLLYAMNLKHFKENDEGQNNDFEYSN